MIKRFCIQLILLLSMALTPYVYALQDHFRQSKTIPVTCTPTRTPKAKLPNIPYEYSHYNDLTIQEGHFDNPFIDRIIIKGTLIDKNCVPVPNALIKLWQQDEYGIYRFIPAFIPTYTRNYELNYQQYSDFIGNGSTLSNNDGEFSFITTIPKGRKILPHTDNFIYLSVEHVNYQDFKSYFTLDSCVTKYQIHHQTEQDFMILFQTKDDKWKIDDKPVPIYTLPIVMNGASTYKKY